MNIKTKLWLQITGAVTSIALLVLVIIFMLNQLTATRTQEERITVCLEALEIGDDMLTDLAMMGVKYLETIEELHYNNNLSRAAQKLDGASDIGETFHARQTTFQEKYATCKENK